MWQCPKELVYELLLEIFYWENNKIIKLLTFFYIFHKIDVKTFSLITLYNIQKPRPRESRIKLEIKPQVKKNQTEIGQNKGAQVQKKKEKKL